MYKHFLQDWLYNACLIELAFHILRLCNIVMASPIPKEGVTLALLQRLRDIVAHTNPEWTTTEVCVNLIKPWTEDKRCSLASLLKSDYTNKEHPDLQLTYDQSCGSHANMFCSHAWRYKFCHVVESLETFILNDVKSTGNAIVWFDLAINDQWNASSLPFEWWCETFQNSIKEIGHTVLVLSPWSDPIPLTRAWYRRTHETHIYIYILLSNTMIMCYAVIT